MELLFNRIRMLFRMSKRDANIKRKFTKELLLKYGAYRLRRKYKWKRKTFFSKSKKLFTIFCYHRDMVLSSLIKVIWLSLKILT